MVPKESHFDFDTKIYGWIAVVLVLVGLVSAAAYRSTMSFLASSERVSHTLRVQQEVDQLWTDLADMRGTMRGFVISGREDFLAPYLKARKSMDQNMRELRELVSDNPAQVKRLDAIAAFTAQRNAEGDASIEKVRSGKREEVLKVISSGVGNQVMADFHTRVQEMRDEEDRLLRERNARLKLDGRLTLTVVFTVALLALLMMAIVIGNVRYDLSGRRQAEDERNRFIASSMDLLAVASTDGYFKRVNPSFERIMGFSNDEILSRPFMEFIHPDDVERTKGEVERLAGGIPTINFENRYRCKDGSYRWVSWMCTPVGTAFYASGRDITAIKQAQELVSFASKMTALGEMAGGIAHEINNPLQIISSNASLLRNLVSHTPINVEKVNAITRMIETTTLRIAKINQGLRFFAREGSNDPFEKAPVRSIVEDTLSFCRERFRVHGITLEVSEIPESLVVECRPSQIAQVLLNLLNNAYQAVESTTEKRVGIEVVDQGSRVEIAVVDSGSGVPAQIREKVFEPFFSTKPVGHGTGLGLSISRGIVESHKGLLSLDSSHNQTRFTVNLPKRQSIAAEAA